MARFQQSTTFNAAPSTVYGYLTDITKHAEWSSHGLTVEKASEGPVAVGSTFNTVGKLMGTHHAVVTVTALVPNERIGFESDDVSGRASLDDGLSAERLAELRDLPLHLRDRRHGSGSGIEIVGQPLDRDNPVRIEEQNRQGCTLLRPGERNRAGLADDLERAQDAELEHGGGR